MAAEKIELVPLGPQTASGAGAWIPVETALTMIVGVDVTAGSSVTSFDAYLEVSDDGGTTVYEMPVDLALKYSGAAGAGSTIGTNRRNIVDNKTTTTAEKFIGVYKQLAADRVRLAWKFVGTSITFSCSAVVK